MASISENMSRLNISDIKVKPMDDKTWKEITSEQKRKKIYPVSYCPRGRVVIISNEKFYNSSLDRKGSDVDACRLKELFKQLHFDVFVHKNLTKERMVKLFDDQRKMKEENKASDAFILCIFSHGNKDEIFGIDEVGLPLEEIKMKFSGESFPEMIGKPKIFIIQACRGSRVDQPVTNESDSVRVGVGPRKHKLADMHWAFATVPGSVSWRNPEQGSWFVQAIVDVFSTEACDSHLCDLFIQVRSKMEDCESNDSSVQVAQCETTLSKQFYFFPGVESPLEGKSKQRQNQRQQITADVKPKSVIKPTLPVANLSTETDMEGTSKTKQSQLQQVSEGIKRSSVIQPTFPVANLSSKTDVEGKIRQRQSQTQQVPEVVKQVLKQLSVVATSHSASNLTQTSKVKKSQGPPLNIMLLGTTGKGKSKDFYTVFFNSRDKDVKQVFISTGDAVKVISQVANISRYSEGREITVVDTPGLCDKVCDESNVLKEIASAIIRSPDGFDAFVVVLWSITLINLWEKLAFNQLHDLLGEAFYNHGVVVFIASNMFKWERLRAARSGKIVRTLEELIMYDALSNSSSAVGPVVSKFKGGVVLFDNSEEDPCKRDAMVAELFDKIDRLREANGGKRYDAEIFKKQQKQKEPKCIIS